MRVLTAISMLMVCTVGLAQEESGPYIAFGIGQLDYEEDAFGLTLDDTTLSYKIYGGYRFDETWAFEAYYGQTDDLEWTDAGNLPGLGTYSARLAGDYDIVSLRGLAHFGWFVVGIGYWDADLSASLTGTSDFTGPFAESASGSDSGASLIAGGEWDLGGWAIRAEFEYFDTESTVDAYNLGIGVQFGF
jgi:hypothetical protein